MTVEDDSAVVSRRGALRRLAASAAGAAVPMLPLGGAALLSACATAVPSVPPVAAAPASAITGASFVGMPAPTLAAPDAMATMTVGSSLRVNRANGAREDWPLAWRPFFVTGDLLPDGQGGQVVAGGYRDIAGRPIVDTSVPGQERQFYSDCPDGTSLLTVPGAAVAGVRGNTVFAVVQFEYTSRDRSGADMYRSWGVLPAPVAVLTIDQNPATGALRLVQYRPVDTAPAHGVWTPCGASLSPWNTHLSSEEYEPDAHLLVRSPDSTPARAFRGFSRALFGDESRARPYHYGHLPEITVHPDGTGTVKKHYCLGRISHELVQVMPDRRTALMGDDATNAGLFMFVADRPADLSAGALYVARWTQTSGIGPGAGDIAWIRLGHARSDEIEALADTLSPDDIMDVRIRDPLDPGFTRIPFNGTFNWVRLRPGMERAAAFLETHRYAALVGGSMGFTKMEGTTVNARDKVAYSAMSYVYKTMLDGSGGIRVQGPTAGAVYAHTLRGGQRDTAGAAIDSEWVSVHMAPPAALVGRDLPLADVLGNLADPERLANPDNLKFSEALRTLFIGEDSGLHVNNFLWAWQVDTGQLTRILSCPAGAESTGLHAVDAINGWTYVMSNFQHPGDWESPLHDRVRATLDPLVRSRWRDRSSGAVGYLTADPAAARPVAPGA